VTAALRIVLSCPARSMVHDPGTVRISIGKAVELTEFDIQREV
jgi:hypothetical protein